MALISFHNLAKGLGRLASPLSSLHLRAVYFSSATRRAQQDDNDNKSGSHPFASVVADNRERTPRPSASSDSPSPRQRGASGRGADGDYSQRDPERRRERAPSFRNNNYNNYNTYNREDGERGRGNADVRRGEYRSSNRDGRQSFQREQHLRDSESPRRPPGTPRRRDEYLPRETGNERDPGSPSSPSAAATASPQDVNEGQMGSAWVQRQRDLPPYMRANFWIQQIRDHLALGKPVDVEDFLRRMKDARAEPTVGVYNNLLSVYVNAGRMNQAFHLYNDMKKAGIVPNAYTHAMLFNVCATGEGDTLARAWQLYKLIQEKDLDRSVETYNSLLRVCLRHKDAAKCLEVFEAMCEDVERYSSQPNIISYSLMMQSCCIEGDYDQARELVRAARQLCKVDLQFVHTYLQACRYSMMRTDRSPEDKNDIATDAIAEVGDAAKAKLTPTAATYDLLFAVLGNAATSEPLKGVLKTIESTPGLLRVLDDGAWASLARATGRLKDVDLLMAVLDLMAAKKIPSSPKLLQAVAVSCGELGDYKLALQIVTEHMGKGVRLTEQVGLAMMATLFRCFSTQAISVPQMRGHIVGLLSLLLEAQVEPSAAMTEALERCLNQRKSFSLITVVKDTLDKIAREQGSQGWHGMFKAVAKLHAEFA